MSKFLGDTTKRSVRRGSPTRLTYKGGRGIDLLTRYYGSRYHHRYAPEYDYYRDLSPIKSHYYRNWSPVHARRYRWDEPYSRYWYDRDYDLGRWRYSLADHYARKIAASPRKSSPKKTSNTVNQETFSSSVKKSSPAKRVESVRVSPPRNRKTFRYTLYDSVRDRLSSPKKRYETTRAYSPARKSLKTRFDVAEELEEETKEEKVTPVKKELGSSSKKSVRTTHTLNATEEDEFVESLRDLVDLDRQLENAIKSLAMRPDFTLYDGFRVFDYDNLGFIEIDDVLEAFEVFGIYPTRDEAKLFLLRFDKNKDNKLNYAEYSEAFTPKDSKVAEILKNRSAKFPEGYYHRRDEFNALTHNAFARVLQLHLEVEINAEAIRQRHEQRPLFDYANAFTTLNQWGDDYLTKEDFDQLFKKYNFYATDNELNTLVSRFDKDNDGKVSYEEFIEEFTPHSPIKYH